MTRISEDSSNYEENGFSSNNEYELVCPPESTVNVFLANSVCTVVQVTYDRTQTGSPILTAGQADSGKTVDKEMCPESSNQNNGETDINQEKCNNDEVENNEQK